jgi:hypothetical protein
MTLRARVAKSRGAPAHQRAYQQSFVHKVHVLLAEGYARLTTAGLGSKEETEITGQLVDAIRLAIEGPQRLAWASSYSVHDDAPLSVGGAEGKARQRIDILFEQTGPGPHPRFHFEAKRLYRDDSVAEYVGAKGLGCFVSGAYAADRNAAGMLGYVQNKAVDWEAKIQTKLGSDRATYGLSAGGDVWQRFPFADVPLTSYRSSHARATSPLDVFHTFLPCG